MMDGGGYAAPRIVVTRDKDGQKVNPTTPFPTMKMQVQVAWCMH
jgi:hypothetical protein